jgi:hypothetical protein
MGVARGAGSYGSRFIVGDGRALRSTKSHWFMSNAGG